MAESTERRFKQHIREGYHPFTFLHILSDETMPGERAYFFSRHSLRELTVPGVSFETMLPISRFYPRTTEELIYAFIMQPFPSGQWDIIEYFRSDLPALSSMLETMPINMKNELLAFVTGQTAVYEYDENPLFLVPMMIEQKEVLFIRTTDMTTPIYNYQEILCELTDEEKRALSGKPVLNRRLGRMAGFRDLGMYDGRPYIFTDGDYEEPWFTKHAGAVKDVLIPFLEEDDLFTIVPFVEEDHLDMENIPRPFSIQYYDEDEHFRFGDFTEYYRNRILKQAMDTILSDSRF